MPKRAHDGAESEAKVVRRPGVLETLPLELVELFAVYAGPQACMTLAQTCRWIEAFLSEPARRRRILEAHTTKVRIPCIGRRQKAVPWRSATITRHLLPWGCNHGVEEMHDQQGGALMRRRHWNNGYLHGLSEYWRKDGSLRWVAEWHYGEPVRFETIDIDGTRHHWPIEIDRFGCSGILTCEWWDERFIENPVDE